MRPHPAINIRRRARQQKRPLPALPALGRQLLQIPQLAQRAAPQREDVFVEVEIYANVRMGGKEFGDG